MSLPGARRVSESWFYKWQRPATDARQQRRADLDAAVKRVVRGLRWAGHLRVATGARRSASRRAGGCRRRRWRRRWPARVWSARPTRTRRRCLTRPDKAAAPIPDLVKRDFTAPAINDKWCGDLTEIPTDEGKLYLATVEDLASRRLLGFALSEHHDSALANAALRMAAAVRGGDVAGAIFHSDNGGEYIGDLFATACRRARGHPVDGPGRVGFDNAAAESFNSTLEWELFRKRRFATKQEARREVARFIDGYNRVRRHSSCEMKSPIEFEAILAARATETVADEEAA